MTPTQSIAGPTAATPSISPPPRPSPSPSPPSPPPTPPAAGRSRACLVLAIVGALLVLAVAIVLGTAIGETPIPVSVVGDVLAHHLFGVVSSVEPIDQGIIWNYRLTRTLVAASCGTALALAGVVLQTLLRNALAEPYLIGISAGASTGAVLVSVVGLGAGALSMAVGAFSGAVLAFLLVAMLAHAAGAGGLRQGSQIVLAGIAGSQLFNAITSLIITRSGNAEQARGLMFWLLGSLSGTRWTDVALTGAVALTGLCVCALHARSLDALTFNTESAASLGVPVRRVQVTLLLAAALMTAVVVSVAGAIGFVGLVIPHAARMLVGARHRRLMATSALMGALFLIAADVLSRTLITGQVLPIGVVTALVGAPVFALLLLRMQRRRP